LEKKIAICSDLTFPCNIDSKDLGRLY